VNEDCGVVQLAAKVAIVSGCCEGVRNIEETRRSAILKVLNNDGCLAEGAIATWAELEPAE